MKISRAKSWKLLKKKEENELKQCFHRACYFEGKRKYEMPLILDVGIISLGLVDVNICLSSLRRRESPFVDIFPEKRERERMVHTILPRLYEER